MTNDFSQFHDAFFEEAAEHVAIVEEGLLALEQHPEDLDLLNKIFRSAHSIKGTSGMFGFNAVAQFTHKMETLLDLLRNGQKVVTPELADLLLRATDCLKTLIDAAKTGSPVDEETVQLLTAELAASSDIKVKAEAKVEKGSSSSSPAALTSASTFLIAWTPPEWLFQRGLDPLQIFKELANLGILSQVTVDTTKLPELAAMDPEKCYLSWTMKLETAKDRQVVDAVFEFVREDSVLTIEECESLNVKREAQEGKQTTSDDSREPLAVLRPTSLSPDGIEGGSQTARRDPRRKRRRLARDVGQGALAAKASRPDPRRAKSRNATTGRAGVAEAEAAGVGRPIKENRYHVDPCGYR
jgi:chemotaxis protein histidine kinase CheA